MDSANYTPTEEREIVRALRSTEGATCPRCEVGLTTTSVPPRSDVPYVRDRLWLACPRCGRSLVIDRRRLT